MSHVTSVDTQIVSFYVDWAFKLATEQVNSSLRIGNSLCSIQYSAQTRALRVPAKIEPVLGRSRWPRFSGCSFFRGEYFTRSFTFRYASRSTLQRAVPIVSDSETVWSDQSTSINLDRRRCTEKTSWSRVFPRCFVYFRNTAFPNARR
jgi:hypothetical protein